MYNKNGIPPKSCLSLTKILKINVRKAEESRITDFLKSIRMKAKTQGSLGSEQSEGFTKRDMGG